MQTHGHRHTHTDCRGTVSTGRIPPPSPHTCWQPLWVTTNLAGLDSTRNSGGTGSLTEQTNRYRERERERVERERKEDTERDKGRDGGRKGGERGVDRKSQWHGPIPERTSQLQHQCRSTTNVCGLYKYTTCTPHVVFSSSASDWIDCIVSL